MDALAGVDTAIRTAPFSQNSTYGTGEKFRFVQFVIQRINFARKVQSSLSLLYLMYRFIPNATFHPCQDESHLPGLPSSTAEEPRE